MQDRKNAAYERIKFSTKRYSLAAEIMVNSFIDLELGAFKAQKEEGDGKPPVFPVGSLIQSGSDRGVDESEYLRWLDKQPSESVLYVSFGSGGTFSHEQLNELALGLEMSGQRFLWVVSSPHEKATNATLVSRAYMTLFIFFPRGSQRGPNRWGQWCLLGSSNSGPKPWLDRGVLDPLWVKFNSREHCAWRAIDCMATLCRAKVERDIAC